MLAFCEGRKHSRADAGEIDTLLRRSTDGGRTWDEARVVATDPGMTVGNPAPVVEARTGTIWLLLCKNPAEGGEERIREGAGGAHGVGDAQRGRRADLVRRRWTSRATSSAREWTWYATGPCHGVQLRSGRLVIPCDHRVRATTTQDEGLHSHLIYSDDHGATWRIGGVVQRGGDERVGGGGAGGRERLPQLPRPGQSAGGAAGPGAGTAG